MSVKKYCDLETLQYYDSKWLLRFEAMEINNNDIDNLLLDNMGIVPTLPTSWTESANGTLDLSLSNAYSYWPEGAGTKTISITNGTTAGVSHFFLKLIDAGNFFVEWGSNIQWKDGSEPEWQAFHEDIIMFKSNDNGNTWTAQVLQTNEIQEYWKLTVAMPTYKYESPNSMTGLIPFAAADLVGGIIDWGDGTIETIVSSSVFPMHTYSANGNYQIKISYNNFNNVYIYNEISGDMIDYNNIFYYVNSVISIDSPLPTLAGSWLDTSSSLHTENSFRDCFTYYDRLVSVPEKLFYNNRLVTSFERCFNHCTSLASIPSGLFDKNTAATSFNSCFYYCTSLQSIPSGLFDKNTAVTNFYRCFYECSSLADFTLHIGSSLVTNCTDFVTKKTGTTRTINVPSGSTTQTTFNNVASSLGLTIVGV